VLSYIWNKTRTDQKKRLLIVDEAWQLMKYDDSANFLFSLAKRARKYFLGMTTITQDVEDFMGSKMGRAIVANASMQMLLKQSTSAVDVLAEVFKLTDEEKKRLSQFPVGQGLFFAGANHVHVQVIASPTETSLITTNPQQLQQLQALYQQGGGGAVAPAPMSQDNTMPGSYDNTVGPAPQPNQGQ
jgi:type IV secretory pathway VirB4 component